eukprot:scaffold67621_cov69-Phaeocystis_antarctica.AAC.3
MAAQPRRIGRPCTGRPCTSRQAATSALGPNPPTCIAYLHSLYGLPNVVDSPCRNRGSHGPVPLPCPLLLCFCTGKSE